jgi:hypothetical protein
MTQDRIKQAARDASATADGWMPANVRDVLIERITALIRREREDAAREARSRERLGPNHKCASWSYSGEGYNRVRLCACGAEDHAPEIAPSAIPARGPQ